MTLVKRKLSELIPYENNPRKNDDAVKAVAESIRQCGYVAPIIVDEDGVILAGHTRLKALKSLGSEEVDVIVKEGLTEEQKRKYRLLDNKTAEIAEWDFEKLAAELDGLDFEGFDFDFDTTVQESRYGMEHANPLSLADRYGQPPVSVLNAANGLWQKRKKEWLSLGIASGKGRDTDLIGGWGQIAASVCSTSSLTGTSVFDPVLAELMYYWFNINGGKIYDCFAGGSVRGVVAAYLGYDYTGIDLSQEQIDEDVKQASEIGVFPRYICDDSLNADKWVDDNSVDMVFSCPPYADLEVYSNDPRDISNMPYDEFLAVYRKIISTACRKLKNDRFAVFVVGDVRDKRGAYRSFVPDTIKAFTDCGLHYYNEIILYTCLSTGAVRAARQFNSGRKVVKTHQNVLVFYKGDIKKIKENYQAVDIDESMVRALTVEPDEEEI